MNQRRKKFYMTSGIIILVLLVVALWARQLAQAPEGFYGSPTPSASATASRTPSVRKATATPSASLQSYESALKQYGNHRIQFDMYCQASPSRLSVSNGTSVMLDNRSGDARVISVGGVGYSLDGYGWKVVTVSSKTLPATIGLDCGSGRNVGTIVVQ